MSMRDLSIAGSSSISAVRYDDETAELEVDFTTGRTYKYREVPMTVAEGFRQAPSAGKYWYPLRYRFPYEEI